MLKLKRAASPGWLESWAGIYHFSEYCFVWWIVNYKLKNVVLCMLIKWWFINFEFFYEVISNLLLPPPNKCTVKMLFIWSTAYFCIMEVLGNSKHKPIKSPLTPNLHLPLVCITLTLMFTAHVAAKALAVFESFVAEWTHMLLVIILSNQLFLRTFLIFLWYFFYSSRSWRWQV